MGGAARPSCPRGQGGNGWQSEVRTCARGWPDGFGRSTQIAHQAFPRVSPGTGSAGTSPTGPRGAWPSAHGRSAQEVQGVSWGV
jgi:hypothetical protein